MSKNFQILPFLPLCFSYYYVFLAEAVFSLDQDLKLTRSYFLTKPSHIKEGIEKITTEVTDDLSCKQLCLREPKCHTINFEKTLREGRKLHLCQIFRHPNIHGEVLPSQEFDVYVRLQELSYYVSSCTHAKSIGYTQSTNYTIDPDGFLGDAEPFQVFCNMTSHGGIGVTVVTHDSEERTYVKGFEVSGKYRRDVVYDGISNLDQLRALTSTSQYCEQFIKYECHHAVIFYDFDPPFSWLVSRDGRPLTYWGGARRGSKTCACGETNSCAKSDVVCNCDNNDEVWREDSGLLSYKEDLPISSLRFGDTGSESDPEEIGYHTLGPLICYG